MAMIYRTLLSIFLLSIFAAKANGQLLGGDIYPKRVEKDTVEIATALYYKCDSQQIFNDTLYFQVVFGTQDTVDLLILPFLTQYDTLLKTVPVAAA